MAELDGVMKGMGVSYEIIVVDDGSKDGTLDVLMGCKRPMQPLVVLALDGNCGQTAAWEAGFRHARGAFVVTMDADMQNDPADIPKLMALTEQYDVVCRYRQKRRDSIVRRASSRIANWVRNRLTHETIRDVGCSLRVIRSDFAQRLKLFDGMHRFLPTLLKYDGARVGEAPVNHRPRQWGTAKYGIGNRLFRGIRDLIAVRWISSKVKERIE